MTGVLASGPARIRADLMRENTLPAVPGQREFLHKMLTGSQAKTAYALRLNAEKMVKEGGINCTGFLTLTIGNTGENGRFQQVSSHAEANRRLNNLNRKILPLIFEKSIIVTERHKSGALHFHLLGILKNRPDIRAGVNFEAFERRDYRSAPDSLRDLWAMLRDVLPRYGFGRHELMPVKKTGEAVASYVSKYIEKNVANRLPQDHRKKLVRYIGWEKSQLKPNEFSWATPRAIAWRRKTMETAGLLGLTTREQCAEVFGPRWAWRISSIWTQIDDRPLPFMVWDWQMREAARRELYHYAKKDALRVLNLPRIHGYRIGCEFYTVAEWIELTTFGKN